MTIDEKLELNDGVKKQEVTKKLEETKLTEAYAVVTFALTELRSSQQSLSEHINKETRIVNRVKRNSMLHELAVKEFQRIKEEQNETNS